MKNFHIENISFPNYSFFYMIASLAVVLLLLYEGRRRKFPMLTWLMVVATGFLFFIMGCKMITFKPDDWSAVLQLKPLHHATGAALLGGILLSFIGLLIARYAFKLSWSMLDAYAFVIPLGMSIQRFGCLLAGCCYGHPAEVPWAIQYSAHSTVYQQHVLAQLIPEEAAYSLGVHPVQLYETIGCIALILLLLRLRNAFKAPVNFLLFSSLLYFVLRFFLEFFRDDFAHAFGGANIGLLTLIQWLFLGLSILTAVIITWREKNQNIRPATALVNPNHPRLLIHTGYFTGLVLLFALSSIWLNRTEILVLFLSFIPIALSLIISIYTISTVPNLRTATLLLMACSVVLMSQDTIERTDSQKKDSINLNPIIETYYEISGGGTFGTHDLKDQTGEIPGSGGCGTGPTPLYTNFDIHQASGSVGVSRTWVKANGQTYKLGLYGTAGSIEEKIISDYQYETFNRVNFWGINPSFKVDEKTMGLGAGLHIGNLYRIKTDVEKSDFNNVSSTDKPTLLGKSVIYPQLSLRIGDLSKWFVKGGLNDVMPTSFPSTTFTVGVGYGFDSKSGSYVTLGHSSFSALFIAPRIVIDDRVTLEPFLGFGNSFLNSIESETNFVGSLNLSVKLGQPKKE